MKKVLIIGNGFDLNLGLKTSYADFIKSESFVDLIRDDNRLAKHLNSKFNEVDWIDIEQELVPYASSVKNFTLFRVEYHNLCDALTNHLASIDFESINKKSKAFLFLTDNLVSPGKLEDVIIFDFNYTPTSRNILKGVGASPEEIEQRLIKIHGDLNTNNIIFGIHDGAGNSDSHVLIKKSCQQNFNPSNLAQTIKKSSDIAIFGYSLGKTDEMYFKDAFNSFAFNEGATVSLALHYYGRDAFENFNVRINDLTTGRVTPFRHRVNIKYINTEN